MEVPEGLLEYFPAILPMDAGVGAGRGVEGVPGAVTADTAGIAGSAGSAGSAGGALGDSVLGFLHGTADRCLPHGLPHGVRHSLSRHDGPGFQRLATLDLAGNRLGVDEGMLAALVELVCGLSSLTDLDLAGMCFLFFCVCVCVCVFVSSICLSRTCLKLTEVK